MPDSADPDRQQVWGLRYLDDLILRDRDTERLYALQDANWNVIALTDPSGDVQERYAYTPYGTPKFLSPTFGNRTSSSYDQDTLYAGYRFDPATGLYQVRYRALHPALGCWLSRDPVEYSDSMNLLLDLLASPINWLDPWGLEGIGHHWFPVELLTQFRPLLTQGAFDAGLGYYSGATLPPHNGGVLEKISHKAYTNRVEQQFKEFLTSRAITKKKPLNHLQLLEFIETKIMNAPENSEIRLFNSEVQRRRLAYIEKHPDCKGPRPGDFDSSTELRKRGMKWRCLKANKTRLQRSLRIGRVKGFLLTLGVGVAGAEGLYVMARSRHYRAALDALERENLALAQRHLIGDDSLYFDLMGTVPPLALETFKGTLEYEFSNTHD